MEREEAFPAQQSSQEGLHLGHGFCQGSFETSSLILVEYGSVGLAEAVRSRTCCLNESSEGKKQAVRQP